MIYRLDAVLAQAPPAKVGGVFFLPEPASRSFSNGITGFLYAFGYHAMIDEALAQFRAHRHNINRYRSLLQTNLTEVERRAVARSLAEEEAAVTALAFETSPPLALTPFFDPDA